MSVANGGTTEYGNNKLTYPVGLLTPDEVAYAGGIENQGNSTYYLNTGQYYCTMGPNYLYDRFVHGVNIYPSGSISMYGVHHVFRVVPAVSLNSSVLVINGTGEYNSPYEIE